MNKESTAKLLDMLGITDIDPEHVEIIVTEGKEGFDSLPDEVKRQLADAMRQKMGSVGTAIIVKDIEDNQLRYMSKEVLRPIRKMLTDKGGVMATAVVDVQKLIAQKDEDRGHWPIAMMLLAMTLLDRLYEEFGDDGAILAALTMAQSDFPYAAIKAALNELDTVEMHAERKEGETEH